MNACIESIISFCTDCLKYHETDYELNNDEDTVEIIPLNNESNLVSDSEYQPKDNFIIDIPSPPKEESPKNKIKIITDYIGLEARQPIYFKKIESLQLEPVINSNFIINISPNNKWDHDFEFIEKND